jgi:curved DNA-binding protein CbpA
MELFHKLSILALILTLIAAAECSSGNDNLYRVLQLSRNATKGDIKEAYKNLVKVHHPDKNGGENEKFERIRTAFEILGNDNKRKLYDKCGEG